MNKLVGKDEPRKEICKNMLEDKRESDRYGPQPKIYFQKGFRYFGHEPVNCQDDCEEVWEGWWAIWKKRLKSDENLGGESYREGKG